MSVPSLCFAIYATVACAMQFAGYGDSMKLTTETTSDFFQDLTDFFLYFCSYDYRVIAVVLVLVTYISFAKPLLISQFTQSYDYRVIAVVLVLVTYISFAKPLLISQFTQRRMHACFAAAHVLAIACAYISTISPNQAEIVFLGNGTAKISVDWTDYWEAVFEWSTFVSFIAFYIVVSNRFNFKIIVTWIAIRDKS
uniref:G_PROTEIN_RECEP_F1_2 domain-containing protein n=1 Tax=Steinernema glaseri TaxID=37863 RepID=A0A1I7Z933_9BILA